MQLGSSGNTDGMEDLLAIARREGKYGGVKRHVQANNIADSDKAHARHIVPTIQFLPSIVASGPALSVASVVLTDSTAA